MKHLSTCRQVPLQNFVDDLTEAGEEVPDNIVKLAESGEVFFQMCDENCPILEKVVARGKELAKKHGW